MDEIASLMHQWWMISKTIRRKHRNYLQNIQFLLHLNFLGIGLLF